MTKAQINLVKESVPIAMRTRSISQRYLKPIIAGLLLCGLSGFALGQALGHRPAPAPTYATTAQAAGALGTATPASTHHTATKTTTTTAHTPPSVVYAPAAYHPTVSHPHPHHKAKHGHHDKHGGDAHHGGHDKGHGGSDGQGDGEE